MERISRLFKLFPECADKYVRVLLAVALIDVITKTQEHLRIKNSKVFSVLTEGIEVMVVYAVSIPFIS